MRRVACFSVRKAFCDLESHMGRQTAVWGGLSAVGASNGIDQTDRLGLFGFSVADVLCEQF
jgi:hypothetical protein